MYSAVIPYNVAIKCVKKINIFVHFKGGGKVSENVYRLCGLKNVINFANDSFVVVHLFLFCDKSSWCYAMTWYSKKFDK